MSDKEQTFEEALSVLINHAEEQAQGWRDAYADFDRLEAAHQRERAEAEQRGYKSGFIAALSQPKYEEAKRQGRAEAFREVAQREWDTDHAEHHPMCRVGIANMLAWLEQRAAEEEAKRG